MIDAGLFEQDILLHPQLQQCPQVGSRSTMPGEKIDLALLLVKQPVNSYLASASVLTPRTSCRFANSPPMNQGEANLLFLFPP